MAVDSQRHSNFFSAFEQICTHSPITFHVACFVAWILDLYTVSIDEEERYLKATLISNDISQRQRCSNYLKRLNDFNDTRIILFNFLLLAHVHSDPHAWHLNGIVWMVQMLFKRSAYANNLFSFPLKIGLFSVKGNLLKCWKSKPNKVKSLGEVREKILLPCNSIFSRILVNFCHRLPWT